MNSEFSAARVYTDLNGLEELRAAARDQSPEATKEVARQFESLLVQMMLKSMRAAGFGNPLFDSDAGRLHRDLFDQQLALTFSRRGELGIASLIERSIAGIAEPAVSVPAGIAAPSALRPDAPQFAPFDATAAPPQEADSDAAPEGTDRRDGPGIPVVPARPDREATAAPPADSDASNGRSKRFASRDAFVHELWPAASRAGGELGVDPELLIAQAALETGWGRAIVHDGRGRSSHNLFGIKADNRWPGSRISVKSLEYEDGVAVRARAHFRSYDSFDQSFDDYAALLRTSPRYGDALSQASDPRAYMHALQSAGYATDPLYAAKVLDIYARRSAASIKLARAEPL